MATIAVRLLLMLAVVLIVDVRTVSGIDIERLNATIDGAKEKFSSVGYFYVDDPLPGEYFDSIVSAAKILTSIYNEQSDDAVMVPAVRTFMQLFKEASLKTDDQGTPFGIRECRLLPKPFTNCRIEPRIAEVMVAMEDALRSTPIYNHNYAERSRNLINRCEAFDVNTALKSTNILMGEHCDKGLGEEGSVEQDMQRRMMQYARENGFEGGNENNCLPLFIARFTQSAQAVRIFKAAVDKYLLAVTTAQAWCTVFLPKSEAVNRAKAVEIHGTFVKSLARIKLNDSEPWACDDVDAEAAKLNVTRAGEIIVKARRKVSSGDYFFNDPSPAEYFDSIKMAASFLAVTLKATTTDQLLEKRKVVKEAFMSFFGELSSASDEQAAPFGLNECWLLPGSLRDNTVVPIVGRSLDAMQDTFGDYEGMAKACEKSNVDASLKTLKALMGKGCEEGAAQNETTEAVMQQSMMRSAEELRLGGGTENNCMHLFVARYKKSEEVMQMFKKSFDKYLLATVAIQAVCATFSPKCNDEAYRANVLETHASFAPSIARIASIQLNGVITQKCDDTQQVAISKVTAACERIKSTAASATYILGEKTAEEFERMMFEMANNLRNLRADVFRSSESAKTPRQAEVIKRTWTEVVSQTRGLFTYLASFRSELSIPFGKKDDRLLPQDAQCLYCDNVFPAYKLFKRVEKQLSNVRVCSGVDTDDILNEINGFIAPGCQDYTSWKSNLWHRALLQYATTHGFDGCDDNKCLQVFIARYTNHSHDAIEKLQRSLDKYVYITVFLKSLCDSFVRDEDELNELRNNTIQMVRSLKDGMGVLRNLSSQAGNMGPCQQTGNTTSAVDPIWVDTVNSYAKKVIVAETDQRKTRSWEARQGLHEAVAKGIVEHLKNSTTKTSYSYEALAYLPYADDERRAFITLPSNVDVVRNVSNSVNYVASRRLSSNLGSNVTGNWASIANNAKRILEFTFSYRSETNLTRRMEQASNRFGPFLMKDGFRTMVALRCGYEFVWYELGYRYFPAGYATGQHELITNVGYKYADKCGQIIFFP